MTEAEQSIQGKRAAISGLEIIKADGERELFDPEKLRESLRRVGANRAVVEEVTSQVERAIRSGDTTTEIYKRAYEILENIERPLAARYSLRRAITEFGPTGFPFEHFVGEIFRAKGFEVNTGVEVQGKCVSHEIDMIAEDDERKIFMEIKFHNSPKIKSDLKVALYVKSRFEDVVSNIDDTKKKKEGWLMTNTKFTKNALDYARCAGLTIVSWSYPDGKSLQTLIEETGLHPITCLTSIPNREKTLLVNQGVVLCRDIKRDPKILEELGLKDGAVDDILDEASKICVPYNFYEQKS